MSITPPLVLPGERPFIPDGTTVLPFAPTTIYRNDTLVSSAELSACDVYYYNASASTLWIYSKRAAGRITAVSPSASAPTSVTVAGVEYTIASSSVASMVQLMPTVIDQLGTASIKSGDTRYETADDMQVYLWYSGQYYATTLSQINTEDYSLIGWYDNFGCSGGGKIRVLVAVKKA